MKKPTAKCTFKVIEDNAGGLHLFIFGDDVCLHAAHGWEQERGQLADFVGVLRRGGESSLYGTDDDPVLSWSEMTASMDKFPHGYRTIADEKGTYHDKMGVAGKREFGPTNLLAAAIKAQTINEAIKPIMDALGIVSGDVAAQSFSTYSQEEWAVMAVHYRVSLIADWLFDELDDAAAVPR